MFRNPFRRKDQDPPESDYAGEGIWFACPDCNRLHETENGAGFRPLLERLCDEIGESSLAIYAELGLGDRSGRWDVMPEQALFKFTESDGRTAMAPYGVVASWNEDSHSWMWAWGFPEGWMPEAAVAAAQRARARGEEEGWQALTERMLAVNEEEAWHLTNLVAHLNGWPLVYRAKVNEKNWHFFAIDRPVATT